VILGDTLNATGPMTGETDLPAVRATLDDLFRRAAAARPDALALIDPPDRPSFTDGPVRRLTYAQADRAISALAARLRGGELVPCPATCSREGCMYPSICRVS